MKKTKTLKTFFICLVIVCITNASLLFVNASSTLEASPHAKIEYGYAAGVSTGTIRYISQVPTYSYYNSAYWGSRWENQARSECLTACMSMALSYVGVNKTPQNILDAGDGLTYPGWKWGNASSLSPTFDTAISNYINGSGKYSPVIIWLPYTSGNHWILVVGRISGNTYLVADPWNGSHGTTWQATISGNTISYWNGSQSFGRIYQYYNPNPPLTGNNPFGYLDSVTAEMGKITVHGWAADMDAPNNPIEVHFYTVQNGQRVGLGVVTAAEYRSDIRKAYPNINEFHGFTATFNTGLSGDVQVEAYGINVGSSGSNVMLWDSPKTVSVPKDTEKPTISNCIVSDMTRDGFKVSCNVNDNIGISYVDFLVWPDENGNWSYRTQRATLSGDIASCYVKTSEHHNYEGNYAVHMQAYDAAGNMEYGQFAWIYVDRTAPMISDVEVVDVSEMGYTVKCKVTDNHSKIDRVQFPSWFEEDNPFNADWSWGTSATYSGKLEDGKYVFRVNTSKYKNQTGKYHTHIYAWDEYGNQSEGYATETIITKAHKHEYISSIKKSATCTEPGIRLYTCKDNDDSYEEEIPATGHQHNELRNVKAATCAQEGYTGDTYCKDCNTKLATGKSIAKKEHTWDSGKITTAATCSGKGIKTYTCTGCNATRTEEIPATGHQHTELRNVKAATCGQEGYTGDTYCKDCNTKLSSGKILPKTEHTWDSGKITTVATCNGKGIKTYTCTGCNATRTEEIPSTGHQHTELRNTKVATCTQEGYSGDTYCKDCNTKLTAGKALPKTDHTWDTGKITTAATCSGKGIKIFTCTVCKSTRIEEIPATGHVNKITKFAKEASCKSEGYTGDVYCQDCGKLLEEGQVIPKTDHVWNKGEVTTSSTCTTEGIKTYTCTSCEITKTEAIAATGHGATEIRNKKDASATSEGYTGDTYCTICNQKISSGNTIAKLTPQTATPGKMLKDKATNGVYEGLQDGVSVEYTKPVYKKASVRIPDTINVNGITCKVTEISANAFKNNKSLKTVSIGRNVTVIGTNAFYGCKKLSKVSGGNGIVKIGHRAFANCSSLSKITIPGSVRSIGKQAFCNCKKLRSITIKTSTLSGKTVGSKAFAGTYKKPTVKVPASKLKTYKKLLKARGMSSKAVYRK